MRSKAGVVLLVTILWVGGAAAGQGDAPIRPGHVTSEVHPGDPLQEISVAGFAGLSEALRFVEGGFATGGVEPKLAATLRRGSTVSFAGASYLVFYHVYEGAPALLSLVRAHQDLHLVVGSCGFQLLVGVRTTASVRP